MLASARGFWARHRRKIFVSLGVAGVGYAAYRLYDAHRAQLVRVERLRAREEQAADDLVKNQLQEHFEKVQRICDTTTLPLAMHQLCEKITSELDISKLTEKLRQGKVESSALSPKEKYDTWEEIKIKSFTKTVSSIWAMTLLSLYTRVQVTILGRHLYLDFARDTHGAQLQEESGTFSENGHKNFLTTADYLPTGKINAYIMQMQRAATEVLKEKQLKDLMSTDQVLQTVLQILDSFMDLCEDNSWISYLVPEDAIVHAQLMAVSSNGFDDSSLLNDYRKLEQLMAETRIVLASDDFRNIMERSLRKIADMVVEDLAAQTGIPSPRTGLPLATLLPRIAHLSSPLLEEPNKNKHIQMIRSMPEVELFYTLLYANMPPET